MISNGAATPDRRESGTMTSYPAFRAIIAEGVLLEKSMPMFDDLTENEIEAVYHYIRHQIQILDQ